MLDLILTAIYMVYEQSMYTHVAKLSF